MTVSLGIFPPLLEIFTDEVLAQEMTLMEGFRAGKKRSKNGRSWEKVGGCTLCFSLTPHRWLLLCLLWFIEPAFLMYWTTDVGPALSWGRGVKERTNPLTLTNSRGGRHAEAMTMQCAKRVVREARLGRQRSSPASPHPHPYLACPLTLESVECPL